MRWMALVLLLLADHAMAKPPTWMKQENPENLGLLIWLITECPFSEDGVKSDIRGEFLRARIKPVDLITDPSTTDFNITISLHCLESTTASGKKTGWSMFIDTRFGEGISLFAYPQYGGIVSAGIQSDDTSFLRSQVKASAEKALTDYLEANFGQ
jgi:hypothetical protein